MNRYKEKRPETNCLYVAIRQSFQPLYLIINLVFYTTPEKPMNAIASNLR